MKKEIIFESHATSIDNEKEIASGHFDPPLSKKGKQQAKELGLRYINSDISKVFCSDLQRSFKTAEVAFRSKSMLMDIDPRLREWNYGDFNGHSVAEIEKMKLSHVYEPFPKGESLLEAMGRISDFLQTTREKRIFIIGHRAVYYTLQHLSSQISFEDLLSANWRWQEGWRYQINI
jgi:broad specificity phosphatase PhoE